MNFFISGHNFIYETQTIIQIFYPNENYVLLKDNIEQDNEVIISRIIEEQNFCYAAVLKNGVEVAKNCLNISSYDTKELKYIIKLSLYKCLSEYTCITSDWGLLTGVRPAKKAHYYNSLGFSDSEIIDILINKYLVSLDKAKLTLDIAKVENTLVDTQSVSVYIGIPFCPTRCTYCSFAAYPIDKYIDKVDNYLDCLIKEILSTKDYYKNKSIRSIYIGGGTPTSLTETQLSKLLDCVSTTFNMDQVKEFTVEAGRPDTIILEKLNILKQFGVNRISINPQTMHQKTLDIIGRKHTVDEFINAYNLARSIGFNNINIDIILGLPNETIDDVNHTLIKIMKLKPSSLTMHTLSIKRAAELKLIKDNYILPISSEIKKMINNCNEVCASNNLEPYYLYRQKNSTGNFENVGYAIKGFEGLYNVDIMSDSQTIIAYGAGSSTKLVFPQSEGKFRIEKIYNVKNVDEYIKRIDEMIENKLKGVYSNDTST